ncbi:hypothetical protein EGH25_03300 [Haladaptatus sp. F3-133]|jgi:hypothetical protein|uniref:Uncharacterized protein n=1 Tax=Halorutilus salinus TaxID=2487751 RepID=A0A9Q4GI16_9EURY|nr:hypothetical protein [Halorutilus salinus]MCX2818378.1 hypothetical protein [Halorutilus salinus]
MERGKEVRRRLWPAFDAALARVGGYAVSDVSQDQYVGTAGADLREVEDNLRSLGFSFEVISALKHRACPNRRDVEAGSWVLRDSRLSSHQLHVHLFSERNEDTADVYAHHEKNWVRHPVKHYRVEYCSCEKGVEMAREVLSEAHVELFHRGRDERCMV